MRILDRGLICQASEVFVPETSLYFVRYIMNSVMKKRDPYRTCVVKLTKTDGFFMVTMHRHRQPQTATDSHRPLQTATDSHRQRHTATDNQRQPQTAT